MVLTFVVAILDSNSAGLVDASRLVIGLPLFLVGFGITVFGYFNLGLGNTYCGADGLVSHGLYRFSRNPQYASSILGLIGTVICANSWLTIPLAFLMSCTYVLMALVEGCGSTTIMERRIRSIASAPHASSMFKASCSRFSKRCNPRAVPSNVSSIATATRGSAAGAA